MKKKKSPWFLFHLSALLLLGFSRLFAQDAAELPGRKTLEKIFNKPGIIKTEVSQEKESDNTRWIEVYTDVHISTDIPMDNLRRVILDFENYPRMFKRNPNVIVIREDDKVYLDMTLGAELLGISFFTTYRLLVTEVLNTPEEFILDFTHASDHSSVKDVYGRWYLTKIPYLIGGKEQFYVRYFASSKVIRKYPLQQMILSMFINSESKDLMNQFLKSARE